MTLCWDGRGAAKTIYWGDLELQNAATLYWEMNRAQYRE